MFTKSTILKLSINTLIGVVALVIWLQFVDINDIYSKLLNANFIWLIPAFVSIWIAIAIRSFRLRFFLNPIQKIELMELINLTGVAMLLNFFIPIRAGDITKGIYIGHKINAPISKSLVWIFLDRFFDFLLLLILVPILLLIVPSNISSQAIAITLVVSVSLLVITYLMAYQQKIATRLFRFFTLFLVFSLLKKHFEKIYLHFLDAFSILNRSFKDLFVLICLTFLALVTDAGILYFCFISINATQSIVKIFLGQLLTALTFLIPAAPGYVGSAEASGLLVFTGILGISKDIVSAMTVIFHGSIALFILIFGIFSLYRLDINLEEMLSKVFKKQ